MCVELKSPVVGAEAEAWDKPKCADKAPMTPGTMSHRQNSLVPSGTIERPPRSTQEDFERLGLAVETLHASGWYHGAMNFTEAKRKLRNCEIGTFLVRDSSDPNYLFTMSVQTPRGTTSVRIEYEYGKFTLDSEEALRRLAPSFDCVVKLLHHYVSMSKLDADRNANRGRSGQQTSVENTNNNSGQLVWLEPSGRRDIVARIIKPLRSHASSLQHLCRVAINRYVEPREQEKLPLPGKLKAYLKQYPFDQ